MWPAVLLLEGHHSMTSGADEALQREDSNQSNPVGLDSLSREKPFCVRQCN